MKKEKNSSLDRRKHFNILLSVVALVLIVAVGGFATYSWIEQSTSLEIEMTGNIQRVPGDRDGRTEYHQEVKLIKGKDAAISLNDYVDKVSDMMLSPVSSADGKNFFMQTGTSYRKGSTSDRNVNYISFDFDVTADTTTKIFFEDGNNSSGVADLANHPKPSFKFDSGNELKSVRVAVQVGSGTPMIFSQSGEAYSALTGTNGSTKRITPKKFSDYQFGRNSIFELQENTKTKVRLTIWIEGTDTNLESEYVPGTALIMKLMLTTPWNKAVMVSVCDKTATNALATGNFSILDGSNNKIADMNKQNDIWTGMVTGSYTNIKFKYTNGSTSYIWNAGSYEKREIYNIFDFSPLYGVWDVEETETINVMNCLVGGTALTHSTQNNLDTHLKISTDGSTYYRAGYIYDSVSKAYNWKVNVDKAYSKLYIQYYSNGSTVTYKWNATSGREPKDATNNTYYLIGNEGGTSSYSSGTWKDEMDIYFYDGTVDQKVFDNAETVEYIAYSGSSEKSTGSLTKEAYCYKTTNKLKYSDRIDRVKFVIDLPASKGTDTIVYTWDGTNRPSNMDIYYTATSYTKD